jgi:hypothetical protein
VKAKSPAADTRTNVVRHRQEDLVIEAAALEQKLSRMKQGRFPAGWPVYACTVVMVLLSIALAFVMVRYGQQGDRYRQQGIRYKQQGDRYHDALARIGVLEDQLAKTPPEKQGPLLAELHRTVAGTGVPVQPGITLPAAAPPTTVTLPAPQVTIVTEPTRILSVTTPILVPVPGPVEVVTVTVTASPSPTPPTATMTPTATLTPSPTPAVLIPCLLVCPPVEGR